MRKTAHVLSIMFLAGCGDSFGSGDMVGTWQATSVNNDGVPGQVTWWFGELPVQLQMERFVIVLNADGTGTWDMDFPSNPTPPLNLTWTVTSGRQLSITLSNGSFKTGRYAMTVTCG